MATQTGKKTSSNRTGGTKTAQRKGTTKKKPGAKKKNQQLTIGGFISKRELQSTLIFVAGLLLLIVAVFPGEGNSLWNRIHTFYYALFGLCGGFIPPAVLFAGIVSVLNKQSSLYWKKLLQLGLLFLIICAFLHINRFAKNSDGGYFYNIVSIYSGVMDGSLGLLSTGGVVGALFGGLFYQLGKSVVLANILCSVCLIADLMFLFGITLFKLFTQVEKPVRKVGTYTGEALENAKTDLERIKRENAENRAARKAEKAGFDATGVVEDFYSKNKSPDASPEKQDAPLRNAQPPADIASIFELVNKKYGKKEQSLPGSDKPSAQDAPRVITSETLDVDPEAAAKQPQEKLDPLSDAEAAELNRELNSALEDVPVIEYKLPPLDCLKPPKIGEKNYDVNELQSNGEKLIAALNSFNVSASIVDVVPGPTVTRYELSPAPGIKISKFVGLADDLALHMAAPAGLRIEAPIPNKAAIGIEIPNRKKATVSFREIIDNDAFREAKSKLNVALGKDISGDVIFSDLAKMPHLLVAGTTGSGKSVCMNTMIVSLLYNATPDEVKILLIDPKQVEFMPYNGIPHLLVPVVSDPRKASGALGWAVTEMLSRYKTLNANGVRDIGAYNSLCDERDDLKKMPQIVIFIDELSDLMTVAPAEVEDSIQRLAQMARAAGMHLVIATQRPSVDVITGVIKANIPSRIALTVKSQVDSRTIIDQAGAEKLMGYGDMLYYPVGLPKPIRVQGAFLADSEIENVVNFIKANGAASYDDSVQQEIDRQAASDKKKGSSADEGGSAGLDKNDDLLMRAIELFVNTPEKASISALQRHLGLGFAKAGRLMDTLEEKGIVGPTEGSKPRKVLITKAQWYEMNAMSSEVTDNGLNADADFEDFSDGVEE